VATPNWLWKETAEIVGALGVIASMIFVGLEIRQNTDTVRGATIQAVSQQSFDLAVAGLDNPDLRAAFSAASEDSLSPDQESLMNWFYSAKLRADENRYRQVELGILDESVFAQLSNHAAYRFAYFTRYWARSGSTYSADFQSVVEREFLPLSQTETNKVR